MEITREIIDSVCTVTECSMSERTITNQLTLSNGPTNRSQVH